MVRYVFADRPIVLNNMDENTDPQKIGEELEKIAAGNGGMLKPEAVVEAAKSKKNALHVHFEWDNERAANAFRIQQARHLIRSISVEDVETEEEAPAFISVTDKGGRAYRSLQNIQESPRLQKLVLESAKRDLQNFRIRYRRFAELFEPGISSAIERIEGETGNDQPSV